MRSWLLLLVACSSSTRSQPAQPQVSAQQTELLGTGAHSCADAALGLENATRGIRAPDHSVFEPLRLRCLEDAWPARVVDCFATMAEGDLGTCARDMPDTMREPIFATLGGTETDRAGIYVTRARLQQVQVGVAECDRFVSAVTAALSCERLEIQTRLQLGAETAEFWSLPTARLSREDKLRMGEVCGQSLASLEQQAVDVGCML